MTPVVAVGEVGVKVVVLKAVVVVVVVVTEVTVVNVVVEVVVVVVVLSAVSTPRHPGWWQMVLLGCQARVRGHSSMWARNLDTHCLRDLCRV